MAYSGGAGIALPQAPRPAGRLVNWNKFNTSQNLKSGKWGPDLINWNNWNTSQNTKSGKWGSPGPGNPVLPANTPNTGGATTGAGTNATTPTATDPNAGLDPTYWANVNANTFDTNTKIGALSTQGAQNLVALQSAIGNLEAQRPYDQLREMYDANRGGGLYSSVYGQNQGLIGQNYQSQEDTLTANQENQAETIANQITGLQQGIPYFNAQEAAASGLRLATALAQDPAAVAPKVETVNPNGSFSNVASPAVPPPPSGPGTPGSTTGSSIAGTFGRGTDWYKQATKARKNSPPAQQIGLGARYGQGTNWYKVATKLAAQKGQR